MLEYSEYNLLQRHEQILKLDMLFYMLFLALASKTPSKNLCFMNHYNEHLVKKEACRRICYDLLT